MKPGDLSQKPVRLFFNGSATLTIGMITGVEEDGEISYDIGHGVLFIPQENFVAIYETNEEYHLHARGFSPKYTPKLIVDIVYKLDGKR